MNAPQPNAESGADPGERRVSELLGTDLGPVRRRDRASLVDLLIDGTGRARRAVVSTGSCLGVGAWLVAVPLDALALPAPNDEATERGFLVAGFDAARAERPQAGEAANIRATILLELDVVDAHDHSVGDVEDLLVRSDGTLSSMLVSIAGTTGAPGHILRVPADRLCIVVDGEGRRVRFDAPASVLRTMPTVGPVGGGVPGITG